MTRFSDAALLTGDYAKMLKEPPREAEWKKTSCDNAAEAAAQSIAKQIFAMQQGLDAEKEKLEVSTFSSRGLMRVVRILPIEGEVVRIDGLLFDGNKPVVVLQHAHQLSLAFTTVPAGEGADHDADDDGLQIGFVIFDELKERKKKRDAAKRKNPGRKSAARKGSSGK